MQTPQVTAGRRKAHAREGSGRLGPELRENGLVDGVSSWGDLDSRGSRTGSSRAHAFQFCQVACEDNLALHAGLPHRWRAMFATGVMWPTMWAMFLLELTYTADLSRIDAAMKSHMRWLNAQYAAGHFLVSGRKVPRDGGIIIARGMSREAIETIAQQDPFVAQALATVRIVEFRASQKTKDAQRWIEAE